MNGIGVIYWFSIIVKRCVNGVLHVVSHSLNSDSWTVQVFPESECRLLLYAFLIYNWNSRLHARR